MGLGVGIAIAVACGEGEGGGEDADRQELHGWHDTGRQCLATVSVEG